MMRYFKNYVFQYTNKNSDCLLLDLTAIGTKNAEKGFLNHGTHGKKVLTTKNTKNTKNTKKRFSNHGTHRTHGNHNLNYENHETHEKRPHPKHTSNSIIGLNSDKFG